MISVRPGASLNSSIGGGEPQPDIDAFVDPEALRTYVKELMLEINTKHSSSHPSVLNGETVEAVVQDTEKYKKEC